MKNNELPQARSSPVSPSVRLFREGAFPALRLLARPSTLAQIPRLLGEGLAPVRRMFIQALNNREMGRLIREGFPVTFVSSYGRSGNTWMRYLICDVLLQNQGVQTTTELPIAPGKIIPDHYAQLIASRDLSVKTPGCMIKTHDTMAMLQGRIGGNPALRQCRYLYLYRTPEDALVSVFHLYLREKYIRSRAGRDIDLFCLEFLPGWLDNLGSYLEALDEGVDIHVVSYEQLLRQPTVVLSEALQWLGIPHTEASVARADSNMQFSKLKAVEAKTLKGRIPFFRRGSQGSGNLELKPETLAKIRDATQHLVTRADQSLSRQSMRNQANREAPRQSAEPQLQDGRTELIPASNAR